jgi:hypothetical protein
MSEHCTVFAVKLIMKTSLPVFVTVGVVSTAMAVAIAPFTSWNDLTQKSSDIVIARCTATTPDTTPVEDGMIWSDIEVLSVLKGDTKPGVARMVSQYWPRQGEQFLMFSVYQSNQLYQAYNATETYRIVPLGRYFLTSELAGKPLDKQIQLVFQSRLDDLNREMKRASEEKKRLEEGLDK